MAEQVPITVTAIADLTSMGIRPEAISFNTLTMASSKWVCVRQAIPNEQKSDVFMIDIESVRVAIKRPITADSAIIHPSRPILALKAGTSLQVYDMERKDRLLDATLDSPVLFWKFIDEETIGLVTESAVYHWTLGQTGGPDLIFKRADELVNHQIINYMANHDRNWLALVGITQQDNRVVGNMQLYSVARKVYQHIPGHAFTFIKYQPDLSKPPATVFAFANRGASDAKINLVDVEKTGTFQKSSQQIVFPQGAELDFPVAVQSSQKYGVLFMVTKFGYIHVYDVLSGKAIYSRQISGDTIFTTAPHPKSGGIVGVNKRGQVLVVTLNEQVVLEYIKTRLVDFELARSLASRANLPGAEDLLVQEFDALFRQGRFQDAAKVAASSPALRSPATIRKFQSLPTYQGQPPPVLQYFGVLLETSTLNDLETIELSRLVLEQKRPDLLQKWFKEDKLACSEKLGDMISPFDKDLALQVYYKAGSKERVALSLAESGQYQALVQYAQKNEFSPNWVQLLQGVVARDPKQAVEFAKMLVAMPTPDGTPAIDRNAVVDIFMSRNMVPETTSFLLDVLAGDRPEDAVLQTRLLEINLTSAPRVADAILGNNMFSHYDRKRVAQLSERAQLFHRALQHYDDMRDIKKVLVSSAGAIPPQFLVEWLPTLKTVDDQLECLRELMRSDSRANLPSVVACAVKYSEQLTAPRLVALFEEFKAYDGLYQYLQQVVDFLSDPDVVFKYLESAARMNQIKEVERVIQENQHYDPVRVRDFLMEARLSDQRPLVMVCNKHDMVAPLTHYLFKNNMTKYIEIYVQNINPVATPVVVGALLDDDCSEDFIKNLINSVGHLCPVDRLVEEVEKRNRLRILHSWLEARFNEGNVEPATHNALAKILIDTNREPKEFLINNKYYDSLVVGKYCEKKDPYLAFVAYKRGLCDDQLIEVTNKHALFKHQARYLVERQQSELWAKVLSVDNEYRRQVIDQTVQTALPECKTPDPVSVAVRAFMDADLPNELIELLEKIVLESSDFSNDRNLQNLLILTAIRADKTRVMDYVTRLDEFDAADIAALANDNGLHEEAFATYKKFKLHVDAVKTIMEHMKDPKRAIAFADEINRPDVWSTLGRELLDKEKNMLKEAIDCFMRAEDPDHFWDVIQASKDAEAPCWEELTTFLKMARGKIRDARIETELVYSLAKTNKLSELEELIASPSTIAQVQDVGDRCYNEELYDAAAILFKRANNFSRLAMTYVRLGQFQSALDACRKAGTNTVWKDLLRTCVDAGEFRMAAQAGINIIVHGDELDDVVRYYENRGLWKELIDMIEGGLAREDATRGMFTELAVLFSKYQPERLMDHLKLFHGRLNISKIAIVCEKNQQWKELAFLQVQDREFDRAARTMMAHPLEAWDHREFKEVIREVTNPDVCYEAIKFYIDFHPGDRVDGLMVALKSKVDATRVVDRVRKQGHLPLIKKYLESIQGENIKAVTEALHELYIEEEDYDALRRSLEENDKFDSFHLASQLEDHELLEFRRIAALLYRKDRQWSRSVTLSKKDKLYKDAIETASESREQKVAEELLEYFVEERRADAFAACLYTCYDLLRPDVVLELAWRAKLTDYAYPYLIQMVREYTTKVDGLVELATPSDNGQNAPMNMQQQQQPHHMSAGAPPLMGPGDMTGGGGGYPSTFAAPLPPPSYMHSTGGNPRPF